MPVTPSLNRRKSRFNQAPGIGKKVTLLNPAGLGVTVNPYWYSHVGAHATNMEVRPAKGLDTVWMDQFAGFPGEDAKLKESSRTGRSNALESDSTTSNRPCINRKSEMAVNVTEI